MKDGCRSVESVEAGVRCVDRSSTTGRVRNITWYCSNIWGYFEGLHMYMGRTSYPSLAWNRWTFLKINGDDVRYRTARISMDVWLPIHTPYATVKVLSVQKAKWHKTKAVDVSNTEIIWNKNTVKYIEKFEPRPHMTRRFSAVLSESLWCTDRRVRTL